MRSIDLNADLGESYGRWQLPDEPRLLALVTSANVACGFHAGDPVGLRRTVAEACARGVAVGAHPGFPDRVGFGRRDLAASREEIEADTLYQIGALQAICRAAGTRVRYVKPHGALYHRATRDPEAARAIVDALQALGDGLMLLGLPGSEMARAAEAAGLRFAREAFIDRGYLPDGTLVPRGSPGALIENPSEAADRALALVTEGTVTAIDGTRVSIEPDSLCIHGDGPRAGAILSAVRAHLEASDIRIAAFA